MRYGESAYQQVSSESKKTISAHKVPLILFQTVSEFQHKSLISKCAAEEVAVIRRADPSAHRDADGRAAPLLYRLILHELTDQFDYDIIPATLVRRSMLLWVHENSRRTI